MRMTKIYSLDAVGQVNLTKAAEWYADEFSDDLDECFERFSAIVDEAEDRGLYSDAITIRELEALAAQEVMSWGEYQAIIETMT